MSLNPLSKPPKNLKGHIIMASPMLRGSVFENACILITEHHKKGAEGFILNHQSDLTLGKVLKSGFEVETKIANQTLHFGGPVDTKSVQFLILSSSKNKGFHFKARESVEQAEMALENNFSKVIPCLGYSGWSEGQLENEFANDTWYYRKPPTDILNHSFEIDLWEHLLNSMSPYHSFIANEPQNHRLN